MAASGRKDWERQQRQERIIDIAEKIFMSHGYEDATLDKVAKASEYSERALYNYFQDKNELFSAIVLRALTILNGRFRDAVGGSANGLEKLRAIGRTYYDFFKKHRKYFELIMVYEVKNYVYHQAITTERNGHFAKKCQIVHDDNMDILLETIEEAVKEGSIKTTLNAKELALLLWGQTLGVIQVISMRFDHLGDVYQTSADKLFGYLLGEIEDMLRPSRTGEAPRKKIRRG